MLDLPNGMIHVLRLCEDIFSERVWEWANVLLIGAIPGPRRTNAGRDRASHGTSERKTVSERSSCVQPRTLVESRGESSIVCAAGPAVFPGHDPFLVGIDETIERRRGSTIKARGVFRDPVRSSKGCVVATDGRRWISMMLLVAVPWALPVLTMLAPSERSHEERKKTHATMTDWARQMIKQLRHWLPERSLVIVGDGTSAVLEFLRAVARVRLDACLV